MSQPYRIALGCLFTECNHFGGEAMGIAKFERNELLRGADVLKSNSGAVRGMVEVLQERKAQVLPLIVASTVSGGLITADCYAQIRREMLDALRAAMPLDGVLLALHGSAVAEGDIDTEGDLLAATRAIVGPTIPIVATLDLHAHMTGAMVRNANALVAWETYPHKDAQTTGQRGARLLFDMLGGRCRPTMAMAKVPVLTSGVRGATEGDDPFADLMRYTKAFEGKAGVLSTSLFLVHPYLDMPEMGSGALVITDNDMEMAVRMAGEVAVRYWARRHDLEPPVWKPVEAIRRGLEIAGGPVLLVETADCVGGGAAGDSVATIKALVDADLKEDSLGMVVDAEAAAACHKAGVGAELTLNVGHKVDRQWGQPATLRGRVVKLSDGRFQFSGGAWGGLWATMGPSAIFQVGRVQILICTYGTYDWKDEQYRSMGIDASQAKFLVVKNPKNYRFAYEGVAKEALILDTPGPTPATVKNFRYRNLVRPYFPADADIPGLTPTVYRSIP